MLKEQSFRGRAFLTTQVHIILRPIFIVYFTASISVQIERSFFLTYFFPQQDSAVQEEPPSTRKIQHVESVDTEEQGQPQRPYEHQENNVHEKARQQLVQNKPGGKKQLEPSLKWKNLGLASPYEYVIIPLNILEVFGIFATLHVLYAFGNFMLQ